MDRIDKCKLAIEKGFKYDPITGEITNRFGKVLTSKHTKGYVKINLYVDKKLYNLLSHQLAWYIIHNEVVEHLDHINGNKYDNRIINLRSVTHQQNHFNRTTAKGYYWSKTNNKWRSRIRLNGKTINLGYYTTEEDARKAYLNAKEIYHLI